MNELDSFEAELRSLKPAPPPADLLARLRAVKPSVPTASTEAARSRRPERVGPAMRPGENIWRLVWRWLAPAAACLAVGMGVWRVWMPAAPKATGPDQALAAGPSLKADDVRIGRELVTSFDAVARLPDGEPVRFRYQEWMDKVAWQDRRSGVKVEQRTPRVEIVPVRFETY